MSQKTATQVGDLAPDFELTSGEGKTVKLSDFRGRDVVVFFYPKDDSPACTAQACSFRDSFADFKDAGAEVIGISSDSEASHQKFANRHSLPYLLLSDPGGKVRAAFGVPKTLGLIPGRTTYVIDRAGIVRHMFSSQLQTDKHVAQALEVLNSLKEGKN